MPRPFKRRIIRFDPRVEYYKPAGVPIRELEEIILLRDEVEALRLCDAENLNQKKAAEKMGVSQPTFHRILSSARSKLAKAVISGKAIRITNK